MSPSQVVILCCVALGSLIQCRADQVDCRNDTSILSKVLGLFDGREECNNATINRPVNAIGTYQRPYLQQNNSTEIFILSRNNRPNLTKVDTEDLIIYPSIDEFCDTTGTQPEKQRCCPVGQWLNKNGTCQSLVQ